MAPVMCTCSAREDRRREHFSRDDNEMCMAVSLQVDEKAAGECPPNKRSACKAA